MPAANKRFSVSQRARWLGRVRKISNAVFGSLKCRGRRLAEKAAAYAYYVYDGKSLRVAADEINSTSSLRKLLGLSGRTSKSALQRSAKLLSLRFLKRLISTSIAKGAKRLSGIDSSGFSASRYSHWLDDKASPLVVRYRKLHVIVDAISRQALACLVTPGEASDSRQFGRLFREAKRALLAAIAGDRGYPSRKNAQLAKDSGVEPLLKVKCNATARAGRCPAWKEMVRKFRADPSPAAYRKARSASENYFSAFKAFFGSSLRSRCWRSQQAELYVKVFLHNLKVIL